MKNLNKSSLILRSKDGTFQKGASSWNKGKKLSKEHKQKLREAKLKNPVRFWQGKKRIGLPGKKRIRKNGYCYIPASWIEEELKQFFTTGIRPVPEHWYIWIKHNKMIVPKYYVIHHINENKTDNRIKNLQLMKRGEHTRLHRKK